MKDSSWKYLKLFAIALLGSAVLGVLNYVSKKKELSGIVLPFAQYAHADVPGGGGESGCDCDGESGSESGGEAGGEGGCSCGGCSESA